MSRFAPSLCLWIILLSTQALATALDRVASRMMFCADGRARRLMVVVLPQSNTPWNVMLTVNGRNEPARISPYVFGAAAAREGFLFAVLPKAGTPPIFIFDDNHAEWGGRIYGPCE
jgi:FlaA1/EpsC-like NDP-sugar epimerase